MHNKFVKKLLKVEKKDSRTLSKDIVHAFSLLHLKWFFLSVTFFVFTGEIPAQSKQ